MTSSDEMKQDLGYVAAVLRRSEPSKGVPVIYSLWAAIIMIGFALPDFSPGYAASFWAVAGPLGGTASFILGWRSGIKAGELDRALGKRYVWHWSLAGLALFLIVLPVVGRDAGMVQTAPYFLLIAGLAYGLAGVHLEPPMRWVGLMMMAGYMALTLFKLPYAWTATGVLVAAGLMYSGWRAAR